MTVVPQTARSSRSHLWSELGRHVPFTLLGTGSFVVIAALLIALHLSRDWTAGLFWGLHPLHVLLSTWASLFHIQLARGSELAVLVLSAFLLLAVWLPCCTSDIVPPILFTRMAGRYDHHPRPLESERAA